MKFLGSIFWIFCIIVLFCFALIGREKSKD